MIQAVFFDFDGVICNTEPEFFEYKIHKMHEMGFPVTREFLLKHVGESFRVMFPREFSVENPENYVKKYYEDMEKENFDYKQLMYPTLLPLLEYCKSHHILCFITSNSKQERLEKVCKDLNIDSYFHKYYSNEVLKVAKPNPQFYEKVVNDLSIPKEKILVIEDSQHGIQAAKDAHLFTIALEENYFHLDQSYADVIVKDHLEIINIIKQLNHSQKRGCNE